MLLNLSGAVLNFKYRWVYVLMLTIIVAAGAACDENARVQIKYEQVANFYTYKLVPDTLDTHSAAGGMFILYRIKKITNTGSKAKTFIFDSHKISAISPNKISNAEPPGQNMLLGPKLVTGLTLQPGQTKTNPGCIIKHVLNPNPKLIEGALVPLIYQLANSQPVSMTRIPADNSTGLAGTVTPSQAQWLCGN